MQYQKDTSASKDEYTIFNMDPYSHFMGFNPNLWSFSKREYYKRYEYDAKIMPKQTEVKRDVTIKPIVRLNMAKRFDYSYDT